MVKKLSNVTGYDKSAISAEAKRLIDNKEQQIANEKRGVIERYMKQAQNNPDDAEVLLVEAQQELFSLAKKFSNNKLSEDACLQELRSLRIVEENKSDKYSGFILGSDLKNFQDALADWDKDVLLVLGGKANAGKSAFFAKLAYEIASHEIENDAVVIYHTIDDTAEQLFPRLISIADGSHNLEINHIKNPGYWAKSNPEILDKRNRGYEKISKLIERGRLIVKDAKHGTNLAYVETLVQYYQEKYPSRQIVYFLDNFHLLSDHQNLEERIRFKRLSKDAKGIATRYHIPMICTMEYTKLSPGIKPSNNNIAETVAMEYDSNLIMHIYNDLHDLGPNATMFHNHNNIRMPRIEIIFGKNKITSFKNSLFFDFYPACSDFTGIDEQIVANDIKANQMLADEEGEEVVNTKKFISNSLYRK